MTGYGMPTDPAPIVKNVVYTACRLVEAHVKLQKLSDSKSAKKESVEKARQAVLKEMAKLRAAVKAFRSLEKVAKAGKLKMKGPFPWGKLFGVAFEGMKTINDVMQRQKPPKVIDAEFEVSDGK